MNYCKCRIPSPSSYHEFCINMGCSKRIKTLAEECTELEEKLAVAEKSLKFQSALVDRYQKYFLGHVMIPNEEYQQMCIEKQSRQQSR